jgi:hypothetical protein
MLGWGIRLLNAELYQHKLFVSTIPTGVYAVPVQCVRSFDAVSRDVLQRWSYPMVLETHWYPAALLHPLSEGSSPLLPTPRFPHFPALPARSFVLACLHVCLLWSAVALRRDERVCGDVRGVTPLPTPRGDAGTPAPRMRPCATPARAATSTRR